MRSILSCTVAALLLGLVGATPTVSAGTILDKASSRLSPDPRQQYARFVRFRPADGQTVTLNPPRFSWPYLLSIVPTDRAVPADQRFTLEIAPSDDFTTPTVQIEDTDCNFYGFLPELTGASVWYWRVGYNLGTEREKWSDTRRFSIAPDAVVWDRSQTARAIDRLEGHPRILFNPTNLDEALAQRDHDPYSRRLAEYAIGVADKAIRSARYKNFPTDDSQDIQYGSGGLGIDLIHVAFAHLLTGDEKYAGCKERFLTMAAWPKGGWSSPEGANPDGDKWETHLTGYLGLYYDWFYHELTPAERSVLRGSIEWRVDHTLNSFAWRKNDGRSIRIGSIAMSCSSHPYESTMVSMAGSLAICDESAVGRKALEIGLHYIQSITSGFGEDEAWKEGAGYGNSKMKWLMDATWYLQTAMPELELGRNEMYSKYRDFFARLTPLGARHCSWGNRGINEADWMGSRIHTMRRVAMLTGDGVAMQNWLATQQRFLDWQGRTPLSRSPWTDYVLPLYGSEPTPRVEADPVGLFPLEGWVSVSSAPPSDYEAQQEAVSMTFGCRPRGGYGHAFRSENAFDIHAYGQTIAVGGGSTSNQSPFANHTMSHNTILVNGQEQRRARRVDVPFCGRIIAFDRGDDFVYWAGDATAAYAKDSGLKRFVRHVLFVDNAYFVIFDDLAMRDDAPPALFQWLYHLVPAVDIEIRRATASLHYAVGDTQVVVRHLANPADLTFRDRRAADGMVNPITGEDLTGGDKWLYRSDGTIKPGKKAAKPIDANHLWIENQTPRQAMNYLAVVVPFRSGEASPVITPVSDTSVCVSFRGSEKLLSFQRDPAADISVDVAAIGVR